MHAQPVVAEAFSDAAAPLSLTAGHFDALASSGGHFARRSRNGHLPRNERQCLIIL